MAELQDKFKTIQEEVLLIMVQDMESLASNYWQNLKLDSFINDYISTISIEEVKKYINDSGVTCLYLIDIQLGNREKDKLRGLEFIKLIKQLAPEAEPVVFTNYGSGPKKACLDSGIKENHFFSGRSAESAFDLISTIFVNQLKARNKANQNMAQVMQYKGGVVPRSHTMKFEKNCDIQSTITLYSSSFDFYKDYSRLNRGEQLSLCKSLIRFQKPGVQHWLFGDNYFKAIIKKGKKHLADHQSDSDSDSQILPSIQVNRFASTQDYRVCVINLLANSEYLEINIFDSESFEVSLKNFKENRDKIEVVERDIWELFLLKRLSEFIINEKIEILDAIDHLVIGFGAATHQEFMKFLWEKWMLKAKYLKDEQEIEEKLKKFYDNSFDQVVNILYCRVLDEIEPEDSKIEVEARNIRSLNDHKVIMFQKSILEKGINMLSKNLCFKIYTISPNDNTTENSPISKNFIEPITVDLYNKIIEKSNLY